VKQTNKIMQHQSNIPRYYNI